MKIQNYKLNEEGLNHFFGPLEAKILEILWRSPDAMSIKQVQQTLERSSQLNFNTVMTVLNRLVDKGHLNRLNKGRLNFYETVQTKEQFLKEQTKEMTHELIHEFGDLVVSHMIDIMEQADPSLLQQLEERLSQLKQGKNCDEEA